MRTTLYNNIRQLPIWREQLFNPIDPTMPTAAVRPDPTYIRLATAADLTYIDHLFSLNRDCLGFLPAQALDEYIDARCAIIAFQNHQPCGFCIFRKDRLNESAVSHNRQDRLFYNCIDYEARNRLHGLRLTHVSLAISYACGYNLCTLRCRNDLDSNVFWLSAGFQPFDLTAAGDTRGGAIVNYFAEYDDLLATPWLPFKYAATAALSVRFQLCRDDTQWLSHAVDAAAAAVNAASGVIDPDSAVLASTREVPQCLARLGVTRTIYSHVRGAVQRRITVSTQIPPSSLADREAFHARVKGIQL